jgi:hypothetical protein
VAGMLFAFFYIGLYGVVKPYQDPSVDFLGLVGQYQIFFTFFGALVIGYNLLGPKANGTVSGLLVFLNLFVLFIGFLYEVIEYREENGLRSLDVLAPFIMKLPFTTDFKMRRASELKMRESKSGNLSLNFFQEYESHRISVLKKKQTEEMSKLLHSIQRAKDRVRNGSTKADLRQRKARNGVDIELRENPIAAATSGQPSLTAKCIGLLSAI